MARNFRNSVIAAHMGMMLLATMTCAVLLPACGHRQETVRGTTVPAVAVSTVAQLGKAQPAHPVVLHGEMIDKCPMAGCWFMLRDKTGVVRVDTKAAGFVVSDVPLHTTLTVAGKVTQGTQPGLAATGIRF